MLTKKLSIYMIKRASNSNIYITHTEQMDLLDNLSTGELKLYSYLKFAPLRNHSPEDFKPDALAKVMGVATQSIRNTLSALRKKGYAIIEFFSDERKETCVKVIVGKDQVDLYNLGLDVEITDAKAFPALASKHRLYDTSLTLDERKAAVQAINDEYSLR